ncbi:MAG: DUF1801 domain-containing protein [Bacteroidales bacterium]|jgi:hypothetical protein|nr:DUF1801 domain-containing protein [Bacteroidales bacterium]NLM91566.1 DUF1801 domain-containing protein [Bacteroidales bacterium]
MNQEVSKFIDSAPSGQKEIFESLRKLIHKHVAGVKEEIKWGRPVFSTARDFAYFKSAKNYATLGFFKASQIDDPKGILEGTGKDMRHIKLRTPADMDLELLRKWMVKLAE